MKKCSLSIAMCTYNGAPFVAEQLESIAAQTRRPDELIVCDDRSSDETVQILDSFRRGAPFPVQLGINQKNLGSTPNFELAISRCRSEVIVLCDQDDVWSREKLSYVEEVFAGDENIAAVFSDASLIDQDSLPLAGSLWKSFSFSSRMQRMFERGEGLRILLKQPVITGATMAFRSQFRELVLPIPLGHVHDHWISLLIACVSRISPIRRKMVQYRKHTRQQIGAGPGSLSQKFDLARRTGRDCYLRETLLWNEILDRLGTRSATFRPHSGTVDRINQRIRHREVRGTLPGSKFRRLPLVLEETVSLRYWRYSNGVRSVAKDLFFV